MPDVAASESIGSAPRLTAAAVSQASYNPYVEAASGAPAVLPVDPFAGSAGAYAPIAHDPLPAAYGAENPVTGFGRIAFSAAVGAVLIALQAEQLAGGTPPSRSEAEMKLAAYKFVLSLLGTPEPMATAEGHVPEVTIEPPGTWKPETSTPETSTLQTSTPQSWTPAEAASLRRAA